MASSKLSTSTACVSHVSPGARTIKYRSTCDNCHRLKVKCGQEKDSCTRCLTNGVECVYGVSRRKGKPREVREKAAAAAAASRYLTTPYNNSETRNRSRGRHESNPTRIDNGSNRNSLALPKTGNQQLDLEERFLMANQFQLHHSPPPSLSLQNNDADMGSLCFDDFEAEMDTADYLMTDSSSGDFFYTSPSSMDVGSPSPAFNALQPLPSPQIGSIVNTPSLVRSSIANDNTTDYLNYVPTSMPATTTTDAQQFLDFGNKFMFVDLPYLSPPLTAPLPTTKRPPVMKTTTSVVGTPNIPPPAYPFPSPLTPGLASRPSAETKSKGRCNHDAFLLEKFLEIENLLREGDDHPCLTFEQLLSLVNSIFPEQTTEQILCCQSCLQTPSSLLSFALLIDKVLALYQMFLEVSPPESDNMRQQQTNASQYQSISASVLSGCLGPMVSGANTNIGTYTLSSYEQTALSKMLLQSRLTRVHTLINRIQAKVSNVLEVRRSTGGMERACQAVTEHVRKRLESLFAELEGWGAE